MHFDDRLQTLLDAPVADVRDRAVRWRQLVDLLARNDGAETLTGAAALDLVRSEAFAIEEEVRAATLRAIAGRKIPSTLLSVLAAQPLRVAASLFAGLTLSRDDADRILRDADPDVRALVRIEVPPSKQALETAAHGSVVAPRSISDMVSRIERIQQQRVPSPDVAASAASADSDQPRRRAAPAQDEDRRLFQWESDASGHIAWVEGAPRGVFVGRPLSGNGVGLLEREIAPQLVRNHPFVDARMALGDLFAGQWEATGVPAFDPSTGRFIGYRGLARRIDGALPIPDEGTREPDLDALREMVHEIKTPLNAIIGFAEIIDGQYLGPAHRLYRERAATIVGQARQLLSAVEDLDFAARVRVDHSAGERRPGGRNESEPAGRLSELIMPLVAEMEQCLASYGGVLEFDIDRDHHNLAGSPELAERMLRRLLLSVCKTVGSGEALRVAVSGRGASCLVSIARPRLLDGYDESELVDPAFDPSGGDEAQSIGLGFAFRLVRGLARASGGRLTFDEHRITLELPATEG